MDVLLVTRTAGLGCGISRTIGGPATASVARMLEPDGCASRSLNAPVAGSRPSDAWIGSKAGAAIATRGLLRSTSTNADWSITAGTLGIRDPAKPGGATKAGAAGRAGGAAAPGGGPAVSTAGRGGVGGGAPGLPGAGGGGLWLS